LHHEIALQNVGPDAPQPPAAGTGLYHVAFEVPGRADFAAVYRALTEAGVRVATVDHLISWAMYFDDPDGNGLEVYWETRGEPGGRELWHGENRPLPAATILSD
jgi:catechol 2,3-dioxygenase